MEEYTWIRIGERNQIIDEVGEVEIEFVRGSYTIATDASAHTITGQGQRG